MSTFTRLAHNALLDAQRIARKPGQDARLVEQASLQAATVYAILDLKATLEEVLTELRDITSKD